MPTAQHLYACDYRWWKYHVSDVMRDYEGQCWTQNVQWDEKGKPVDPAQWGIKRLESLDKPGLSTKQGIIHRGSNSGYQAVNLALLLGAERIILLGFDMMKEGNKTHFFGDHPAPMNAASPYASFIAKFDTVKPEDYGIEIWNCSRRTALTSFPVYSLDDVAA